MLYVYYRKTTCRMLQIHEIGKLCRLNFPYPTVYNKTEHSKSQYNTLETSKSYTESVVSYKHCNNLK